MTLSCSSQAASACFTTLLFRCVTTLNHACLPPGLMLTLPRVCGTCNFIRSGKQRVGGGDGESVMPVVFGVS